MEQNAALLVMDMQTAIISNLSDSKLFTDNVGKAIAHARKKNIPVIYVVVGFRQGIPEISDRSIKNFVTIKKRLENADMAQWTKIEPAVQPLDDDIVVVKRRTSAFTGSDLEVILRALHINHLILTGIATGGVVLSTVREAADKDFQLTVLSNACADADDEIHRVLTEKVFPRQATVITVEEWNSPR
jgi:Amidases related to nicotinamidase